jgi:hypothetical protein
MTDSGSSIVIALLSNTESAQFHSAFYYAQITHFFSSIRSFSIPGSHSDPALRSDKLENTSRLKSMPPASSPQHRPSTPTNDNYLQHIEAIATPVPDFASTLSPNSNTERTATARWLNVVESVSRDRARNVMQSQRSRVTRTTISATVQRELDRRSYATTGDGPNRQSLYDWAVTGASTPYDPHDFLSSDSETDVEAISTAAASSDPAARRDLQRLERALQSYRSARNALRNSRAGNDLGAVPTASALRAYWNEEDEEPRSMRLSNSADRYRRDFTPRHAQNVRSTVRASAHTNGHYQPLPSSPKRSDTFLKVRKLIRYLTMLRDCDAEDGGLQVARDLGLDSMYVPDGSGSPSDVPIHIDSMPAPEYSHWLEPGMVWHGLQSTERETPQRSTILASSLSREQQRDLFRRSILQRERARRAGETDPTTSSLLDSERYLSDLLQDSNGRWTFGQNGTTSLTSHPPQTPQPTPSDNWPVTISLESVDWDKMTVTGKMSASHMPEKLSSQHQNDSPEHPTASSMSSFFTGEIIDFRRYTIETLEGDYDVGGLDVDARYWQRVGPFKREIEQVRRLRGRARQDQDTNPLWDAARKIVNEDLKESAFQGRSSSQPFEAGDQQADTREQKEAETNEVMASCLGSTKWIQEQLGQQWILMRLKERNFVNSPLDSPNDSHPRTITTTRTEARSVSSSRPGQSWGLTISGFYYIALDRMTGEIDGLYYDHCSQPYQALKMVPEGTPVPAPGRAGACPQTCGCGDAGCPEPVGVKMRFPSLAGR